ncbi:MAG: S49 family peptidase [Fermentimonas sp.]|nr:S49 family peptidase [Fermentimonas sp.]MDD4009574.1 S49 family peptidase [Fermentimonas sp.]MDD4698180.1 S49 family peptidase [Fermentimonas sp.]
MNSIASLIRILTDTNSGLFITQNEYISELASLLPYFLTKREITNEAYIVASKKKLYELDITGSVKLTDDYTSTELDLNTLAYHRVFGTITADSYWRVSTKQLQRNLIAADANNNISGHFVHISSGGGEAWYLDQLAETMRSINKPIHAYIERVCGSAAYYIASQSDFISASTPFDLIGCIGTMVSFMDMKPMFEKWGMKFIEEYATNSDLKNKKYNDLLKGSPGQFIREELDPLRDKFVADVKLCRETIAKLPEDHPVLHGETFYASKSIENGLIDAVEPFGAALQRANDAALEWNKKNFNRKQALQILNQ